MNELTQQGRLTDLGEDRAVAVLQSSLYPGASADSVRMVLAYCRVAGLDPMQKPVHLVPMWDSKARQMRDVIMPGVNLYRIQASRSGQFAGVSEPEFGPDVTAVIGGVSITYPEWARVVVKRQLASGHVAEFAAREYWVENYAAKGGADKSPAPNAMWAKRPRGQIAKCATAQALRAAFPELASQYTAEEMEGKDIAAAHDQDTETISQDQHMGLTAARAKVLRAAAAAAIEKFNVGDEHGAYEECEPFSKDSDEALALWSTLKNHSSLRSALKRIAKEIAAKDAELAASKVPGEVVGEATETKAAA
jgi:phage recombination protein Bet